MTSSLNPTTIEPQYLSLTIEDVPLYQHAPFVVRSTVFKLNQKRFKTFMSIELFRLNPITSVTRLVLISIAIRHMAGWCTCYGTPSPMPITTLFAIVLVCLITSTTVSQTNIMLIIITATTGGITAAITRQLTATVTSNTFYGNITIALIKKFTSFITNRLRLFCFT